MRTFLLIILILAGGPTGLWAQDQGQPAPKPTVDPAKAPRIYFAVPKHNFGIVDEGPEITHLFRFTNKGKGTLKIQNVQTSCGCTAAAMSDEDKTVEPGGSGTIKVTYHTEGRPGPATKIITITSNDPVSPSFQLELKMEVVREVNVQPQQIYLYGVKRGEGKDQPVTVVGKPNTSMKVLSAKSTKGVVTILGVDPYEDKDQKRKGSVIRVRLPETTPIGRLDDEIQVETDYAKKKELTIRVVGEIQGRVHVSPDTLYFQAGQKNTVTAQVDATPPEGFVIRSVRSEKHLVRPSIRRNTFPDGRESYVLTAKPVRDLPKDSDGKDRIVVETNDPEQPEVFVEVKVNPR